MAKAFNYNENNCLDEITKLIRTLLELENKKNYIKFKHMLTAEQFWKWVLDKEEFAIGSELKKLVLHIMALPIGSADSERGFSIFNTIKTKRTARITAKNVDARLRLI